MSGNVSPPPSLRFEIGGAGSQHYKSLDYLVWDDVPPLSVLTGPNGSGKTQLLELLAYKLTGVTHPGSANIDKVRLSIAGDQFGPESVAFIPSRWEISGTSGSAVHLMHQAKQELHGQLRNVSHHDFVAMARRARIATFFGKPLESIDQDEFTQRLPDDFAFMLDDVDVTFGLAQVFIAYRLRMAEARERGMSDDEARQTLGPAPWVVLNETFAAAEFPFRVRSPLGTKLLDWYDLVLEDIQHGHELRPMDLSSGEKTLLGLVLWLYNSGHFGRFPKLLLLDEPDAHLHPSMTRHFIDVISEVLVRRYGVRVILTTHSPSTVALAPEGSVFEMRRSQPRIVKSPSKADTIGVLTAGLVVVSTGSRHVLVEDEDDVLFYETVRDVLTDYGPTRDPRALKPAPTVTFLPASVGTGKGKIAGGRSVVVEWLHKLDAPPLAELVRGVIDRDLGNEPAKRLAVLGRYSIENYLLDPFVVFAVLLDQRTAPSLPGISVPRGQEHLVRMLLPEQLQTIADVVLPSVASLLGQMTPEDTVIEEVSFTNGAKVRYPRWLLAKRGHDLLPLFQRAFGGPGVVSPPRLRQAFARVRLIPSELADVMHELQS